MFNKGKSKIKVKDSEAEIEGDIPWEDLRQRQLEVLEELRKDFAAPGFRKGHVPMEIFLQNFDEHHALEDAAERALQEAYPSIISEHELETLGRPEVTITKLAKDNPMGFRIKVGVVPEVKLPNYKKVAKGVIDAEEPVNVTDEDVDKVINDLRRLRASQSESADGAKKDEKDTAGGNGKKKEVEVLPELTDEFVKSMGDFKDVADFREKLAANMRLEKETGKIRERRERIAAALGEKAKMTLPESVLDAEATAMEERLAADLERNKVSMEDYLAKINKTLEELRSEHRAWAERQLKTRFILDAIAKAEDIAANSERLAKEMHHLKLKYPEADPEALSRHAETMLRNEKVLQLLEGKLENENDDSGDQEIPGK